MNTEPSTIHPKPTPTSEHPSMLTIEPYEIETLAGYGPQPQSWVQTFGYALRVKIRQRDLRRALRTLRTTLHTIEQQRDQHLAELGHRMRYVFEKIPELSLTISKLASAEQGKQKREASLAYTSVEFRTKTTKIDHEIASLEESLPVLKQRIDSQEALYQKAESLRIEHEERRKQTEIEVQHAHAVLARIDSSADIRQRAQQLIASVHNEKSTRAVEEQLATEHAQKLEVELAFARRAYAEVQEKMTKLRQQRKELELEFTRQGSQKLEQVDAASHEVQQALCEIGIYALDHRPQQIDEVEESFYKKIEQNLQSIHSLQYQLECHLRALESANARAVKTGTVLWTLVIIIGIGLFTLILWRIRVPH